MSLSPKHLKFWVESYLNKPNSKLHFQFKDIKLSLSQFGVLPIIGLKSSEVNVKVKPFKNSCFDVSSLKLNTILIKINPLDLLFGKLYFNSINIDKVNLELNSFCDNLSVKSLSSKMSYFMHHKSSSEIDNFIKWIEKIKINNFVLNNQFNKLVLIKNLKLESYKQPKFILISGDTFPYLKNSFTFINHIKPKIFIYPDTIKAKWWWHLHEGVVKLDTQLLFSTDKRQKLKYKSNLKLKGDLSYLPISSVLYLLNKTNIIDIKFPELNIWLSCGFAVQLNFFKSLSAFSNSQFSINNCNFHGKGLTAKLNNSRWKLHPFRVEKNINLSFSNLYLNKLVNPILSKWKKKSTYFTKLNPTFAEGVALGKFSILKNGIWNFDANIKNSVLKFTKDKKLEWLSVSKIDLNVKTTSDLSNIFVKLNNIATKNLKNTKMFFKYKKVINKDTGKHIYKLNQIKFNKKDLSSLKSFPFLNYLEQMSAELNGF